MPDGEKAGESGTIADFAKRTAVALTIGTLFLAAFALLRMAGNVLLLAFAGMLFAILLRDIVDHLGRWLKLPSGVALALTILAGLIVLAGTGWLIAPRIAEQTEQLRTALPDSLNRLQAYLERYEWGQQLMNSFSANSSVFPDSSAILSHVSGFFTGLFGAMADFLVVAFVGIYLAAQPEVYIRGILKLLPGKARPRAREVLQELGKTLRLWLRGKVLSMAIIGLLTTVGLFLLGVPLALTIGLLAGLLDFIPYIGPVIAAAPAILITLPQDPMQSVYVVALFVFLQSVEGYLLLPLVERRAVSLPPGLIILMQVLFGLAFGLLGVAMATPVTATAMIVIALLYVQDVLGDDAETPGGN